MEKIKMDLIEFSPIRIYQGIVLKLEKTFSEEAKLCNKNESFSIDCEFRNGMGWSVFKPIFSQSRQFTSTPNQNDGCENPGCFGDQVSYSLVKHFCFL